MGHLIFQTRLSQGLSQKNDNFEISLVPKLSHNVRAVYYHIYFCMKFQARKFQKIVLVCLIYFLYFQLVP